MADQQTPTTAPNMPSAGMIKGLHFAIMIIIGAFVGNGIIYSLLFAAFGILAFVVGIALVVISSIFVEKTQKVSGSTYLFVFLGCVGIPLLGGIIVYTIAKRRHLTP